MNWTVQCAEYHLYRSVSRTNAYEFMQQSGSQSDIGFLGPYFHLRCPDTEYEPLRADMGQVQHGSIDLQSHR